MGNEYEKIVLLNELDVIDDYSFKILKNFLARDLQWTKKMEEKYGRTKVADLMEEKFQGAAYRMLRRAKLKVTKDIEEKITLMKSTKQETAGSAMPTFTMKEGQVSLRKDKLEVSQKKLPRWLLHSFSPLRHRSKDVHQEFLILLHADTLSQCQLLWRWKQVKTEDNTLFQKCQALKRIEQEMLQNSLNKRKEL
ncbi:myeloid cell nuclear differentiation antigen-like [Elephas maximus indicus]|uniref:myeloid cell nuclear differentiation antigen-like n=1 Tax=Elephas maximus indicus TaxID=99487 RepID=UPI00211607DA|nr:myeloid cell nuclear differentiation antigen-like [Elephas maximus indicus]XP_049736874.1 myeloid cell nuclear differentiation antigen-like [Elephas maximus indicus]XP_049736875.1 myeloid cell nuclear differentiation antigen-like [Elephas maximus indicus]